MDLFRYTLHCAVQTRAYEFNSCPLEMQSSSSRARRWHSSGPAGFFEGSDATGLKPGSCDRGKTCYRLPGICGAEKKLATLMTTH